MIEPDKFRIIVLCRFEDQGQRVVNQLREYDVVSASLWCSNNNSRPVPMHIARHYDLAIADMSLAHEGFSGLQKKMDVLFSSLNPGRVMKRLRQHKPMLALSDLQRVPEQAEASSTQAPQEDIVAPLTVNWANKQFGRKSARSAVTSVADAQPAPVSEVATQSAPVVVAPTKMTGWGATDRLWGHLIEREALITQPYVDFVLQFGDRVTAHAFGRFAQLIGWPPRTVDYSRRILWLVYARLGTTPPRRPKVTISEEELVKFATHWLTQHGEAYFAAVSQESHKFKRAVPELTIPVATSEVTSEDKALPTVDSETPAVEVGMLPETPSVNEIAAVLTPTPMSMSTPAPAPTTDKLVDSVYWLGGLDANGERVVLVCMPISESTAWTAWRYSLRNNHVPSWDDRSFTTLTLEWAKALLPAARIMWPTYTWSVMVTQVLCVDVG